MRKRAEEAVPIVDDVKDVGAGLHVERDLLEDLVVRHRDDVHLGPGRFLEGFPNHTPADHMRLNHHEVESHAGEIGRSARPPGTQAGGRAGRSAAGKKPSPRQRTGKSDRS